MGRVRALLAALVTVCGLLLGAVEVLQLKQENWRSLHEEQ